MLDPGDGPTHQSAFDRRDAPTVALRGLLGRSRVHVIPCWLNKPGRAGRHDTRAETRTHQGEAGYIPPYCGIKAHCSTPPEKQRLQQFRCMRGQIETVSNAPGNWANAERLIQPFGAGRSCPNSSLRRLGNPNRGGPQPGSRPH